MIPTAHAIKFLKITAFGFLGYLLAIKGFGLFIPWETFVEFLGWLGAGAGAFIGGAL